MSRGNRQLFGLRLVLSGEDADLILLDEPWEGLDPAGANWLTSTLQRWRAAGAAVLVSSHRLHDLDAACTRFLLLRGGRSLSTGRPGAASESRAIDACLRVGSHLMVPAFALFVVFVWLQYGLVTVTYHDVPADVTDVRIYEWKGDGLPVPIDGAVSRRESDAIITASARASVVVAFSRGQGDYVLDGPFALARSESRSLADGTWRRSGRGALPSGVHEGRVEWIGAGGAQAPWPQCFCDAASWECWGIASSDRGVVTTSVGGRLWWGCREPLGRGRLAINIVGTPGGCPRF